MTSPTLLLAGALGLLSGLLGLVLATFGAHLDSDTHALLLTAGSACALVASSLALRPSPAPALPPPLPQAPATPPPLPQTPSAATDSKDLP